MSADKPTYQDLAHTSLISLRTYMKIFSGGNTTEKKIISSEGAYRIGLCYARNRLNPTEECWIKFGDVEIKLCPSDLGENILVPAFTLYLDGSVDTVRDDEITFRFVNGTVRSTLIVLFDRVVWKKDDNYYPATAENKAELAKQNGKK